MANTNINSNNTSGAQSTNTTAAAAAANRGIPLGQTQAQQQQQQPNKSIPLGKDSPSAGASNRELLDYNKIDDKDSILRLNFILNSANPIVEKFENQVVARDADGKDQTTTVVTNKIREYSFPSLVDGKPFTEWIKDKFGQEYEVDVRTKEVYKVKTP